MMSLNGATFSKCGKYRYKLWRGRDKNLPVIAFIGINPSKADAIDDDATIRRVTSFAWNMGYGKFYMINIFPYIATKQKDLKIGGMLYMKHHIKNLQYLEDVKCKVDVVVFAWGRNKLAKPLVKSMKEMFPGAMCFGTSRDGSPKHPLYLSGKTKLVLYDNN